MLNFKQFLIEYLTDKQRDRYRDVSMYPEARKATDHFFGVDNDKVHGSLDTMTDKSEIHKKVEGHLGKEISHDSYRAGMTTDHLGRQARIGRLIKDPKLKDEFARDPTREGSKNAQSQYTTSTVRGVEVAGQTNSSPNEQHPKGHSWGELSCKNVDTGINKQYLHHEIKSGTVAHFVHDRNGQEIYRATLQPHHNDDGDVAYSVDAEYGIKHPKFTEDAHRVSMALSTPNADKTKSFHKDPDVYNDSGNMIMPHPNASNEDLSHILKHGGFGERKAALSHKNIEPKHLEYALRRDPSHIIRATAARHPKATHNLIHMAMEDPSINVVRAAVSNKNASEDHLDKAISHQDTEMRSLVAEHPNANRTHMMKAANDSQAMVRDSLYRNPATPVDIVNKGLEDSSPHVRYSAIKNPHITKEQLTHLQSIVSPHLRRAVLLNPNSDVSHVRVAKNDSDKEVRAAAARHTSASPSMLHSFLDEPDSDIYDAVASNPRAKPEHLHRIMSHYYNGAKAKVLSHPNADEDLVQKGLEDKNDIVRDAAFYSPKRTREHVKWAAEYGAPDIKAQAKRILESQS